MKDKILGNKPRNRAEIIIKIAEAKDPLTMKEISKKVYIKEPNVRNHLEILRKHEIVVPAEPKKNKKGKDYLSGTNKINENIETLKMLITILEDDYLLRLMQTKYFDNKIPELVNKFESVCKENGIRFDAGETDWLNLCFKNSITLNRAVLCDNLDELLKIESQVDLVSTIYNDAIPKTFQIWSEYINNKKVKSPVDTTGSPNKILMFAIMRHLLGKDSVNKRYIKELDFEKAIQFARTRHGDLVSQYAYLSGKKIFDELGINNLIMDQVIEIIKKDLKSSENKDKKSTG